MEKGSHNHTMDVEKRYPESPIDDSLDHTETLPQKVAEEIIDKGNEAVLLDVGAAGIGSDGTRLKLAKDGHVSETCAR